MLLRHRACVCIPLLIAISAMSARSVLAQTEANEQPGTALIGDMPKKDQPTKDGKAENPAEAAPKTNPSDPTATLKQLGENVWIDTKNHQVVVDGQVCLTRGMLEMFAVPKGTKEHESVVSVDTKAQTVHAALLAAGAVPGTTVKYQPKYTAATGPKVDVLVYWTDANGKPQKSRAQDWVRDIKTKKAMDSYWVFGGSGFYTDEETKKQYYLAEAGDLICVSNFPDAMMDLPIESTDSNDALEFEAFTEHIPPRGTKVTLVLAPQIEKKADGEKSGK